MICSDHAISSAVMHTHMHNTHTHTLIWHLCTHTQADTITHGSAPVHIPAHMHSYTIALMHATHIYTHIHACTHLHLHSRVRKHVHIHRSIQYKNAFTDKHYTHAYTHRRAHTQSLTHKHT